MNDIWNPWHGCKKYSEGCENCYMYYLDSQRDKEKNSKIEILQTVEDKTREIQEFLSKNIETLYEENEGNHFKDGVLRMAKGIKWILE